MAKVLGTGVRVPHIEVFDSMVEERFSNLDIAQAMPNFIDHVNETALYWLASQFDILGDKGFAAASTVEEKREIVKAAIALHRYKGTVYAIRQAILELGYSQVDIHEGVAGPNGQYDGTWQYDGVYQYGLQNIGNGWATFSVVIYAAFPTTTDMYNNVLALINENKNARSMLVSLSVSTQGLQSQLQMLI